MDERNGEQVNGRMNGGQSGGRASGWMDRRADVQAGGWTAGGWTAGGWTAGGWTAGGWTDAAHKLYHQHKFEDIKINMKQTWKVIKSVINNNWTSTSVMEIISGDTVLKDPKLIVNKFNSYFTSIGQI